MAAQGKPWGWKKTKVRGKTWGGRVRVYHQTTLPADFRRLYTARRAIDGSVTIMPRMNSGTRAFYRLARETLLALLGNGPPVAGSVIFGGDMSKDFDEFLPNCGLVFPILPDSHGLGNLSKRFATSPGVATVTGLVVA